MASSEDDRVRGGGAAGGDGAGGGGLADRAGAALHLERIERLDPQLNSFRVVLAERALLEAEQAEARLKGGDERPLLGVPIALKDEVDVAGEVDHPRHRRLPRARHGRLARWCGGCARPGAIVVGKTLLPELAICGFTESATWGVTRNPWDPQRTPGGSSGGSAAAVAAGLVPIASASDGAGSIRIPAASCGLFGLKPQRGRVSLAPDLEHWNGLSVNGCVSRTVLDTALWLDVVSGGSAEPGAPPPPERPFVEAAQDAPGKLRVAYSTARAAGRGAADRLRRAPRAPVAETAELLRSLGHEAAQRDPDWGGDRQQHHAPLPARDRRRRRQSAASRAARTPHPRLRPARPPDPRPALRAGAPRPREADAARVNAIFDSHDVLMTPVMGGTALPVRRWEGRGALWTVLGMSRFYPYCIPWNHLGNPAMSVPAGFAADGMPLSVQIIGRPGDEATLLSLAAQLEAERPWADRRPPIS